ncbi:1-deoxy-D-xylulose-5-phosphate reductoisomerase [Georgenia sp. TF02-10]|uniref:1-deoxy-D-xylulose-5-phosphate reductoisomerase n=1 Tax=Georgenia sp. TF02-10 TaxID=2917725 RepID=UPI001FA7F784|nr:1-deoxy-D-xylulose-5-phosphate reductoisomerase [Georgenia sp. TF02-10]UNX55910.1 1-deoxy-D-xylulose-5-phosphate reductoisomerase [Georgenia sp. TF02-10]
MRPTDLVLLGSTGSIGTQALDVVAAAPPGTFRVRALAAGGGNLALLAEQALAHDVPVLAVASADPAVPGRLRELLADERARTGRADGPEPEIRTGPDAVTEVAGSLGPAAGPAAGGDGRRAVVLNGITGSVGLAPTLAALRSGATLALANKESLVVGGALVKAAQQRPGQVVPVDSEHSALAQALRAGRHEKGMTADVVTGRTEVRRLVLTASGGPFRGATRDRLARVTPAQALAHPTWTMGPVVTVNSATLVNKGLELIEAHLLFDVPVPDITVVVHPQSVVHSMVEFHDGSTVAQASPPDMHLPIALGLTWPDRAVGVAAPCAWDQATAWTFEPLDDATFPAVGLARSAATASPSHPAVLNAANEQCVAAFLQGRLTYLGITDVVQEVLAAYSPPPAGPGGALALADVLGAEEWARARAEELIARRG